MGQPFPVGDHRVLADDCLITWSRSRKRAAASMYSSTLTDRTSRSTAKVLTHGTAPRRAVARARAERLFQELPSPGWPSSVPPRPGCAPRASCQGNGGCHTVEHARQPGRTGCSSVYCGSRASHLERSLLLDERRAEGRRDAGVVGGLGVDLSEEHLHADVAPMPIPARTRQEPTFARACLRARRTRDRVLPSRRDGERAQERAARRCGVLWGRERNPRARLAGDGPIRRDLRGAKSR
jgi:hypothetical protein